FPEPHDRRRVTPIYDILAGNIFHARTASADELEIGADLAQRIQQLPAVLVPARFARDEIKALRHSERN
ncbi:MAG: hypothetical protein QOD12_1335, partial [Verrucomicrobiota bacterium]